MSDSERPSLPDDDNIEQSLLEAETALNELKERYHNVQAAQKQQPQNLANLQQLRDQAKQIQKKQAPEELKKLKEEIRKLQERIELTELTLESSLFTWRDKRDWFWHFLRFAGIGFGAALLLNHLRQ